jgi:Icc-related predicted phosphoesterase
MKIVAMSDVHNRYQKIIIPTCDLLISCGDYSSMGRLHEVKNFHKWIDKQPATHIISCQGNHELQVEKNFQISKQVALEECPRAHFLDEGPLEIEGVKIWCSAITPFFCNWAWNRFRGPYIKEHWDRIPEDIDILVTHGPPYGILDTVYNTDGTPKEHVGCQDLYSRIWYLKKIKLHFFGHIHNEYGHKELNGVKFYNASICDETYNPVNLPTVVEI